MHFYKIFLLSIIFSSPVYAIEDSGTGVNSYNYRTQYEICNETNKNAINLADYEVIKGKCTVYSNREGRKIISSAAEQYACSTVDDGNSPVIVKIKECM